jgi:hypothetical protein
LALTFDRNQSHFEFGAKSCIFDTHVDPLEDNNNLGKNPKNRIPLLGSLYMNKAISA